MGPPPNLVYYAAVARGTVILADYSDGNADLPPVAAKCLEMLPPLHDRFSYTARNRRFICLIEGLFIYCAIVDEAVSKAEAFSFLEQVKNAFKASVKQQGVDAKTLGPRHLNHELTPIIKLLAAPIVGIPQKEKDRIEAELQAQRDAEVDFEVSSPSAVAPLREMSDQDFDLITEDKPLGSRSPRMPLIAKGKKDKRKVKDQIREVKDIILENKGEAMDKGRKLEIMVEGDSPPAPSSQLQRTGSMKHRGQQLAHRMWWRNVRLVIILDILVCLILLAVWLTVCKGVRCLQK